MQSVVSIEQQSPRRPCDILAPNMGPEVAETAKTAKTAKCVKKCAKLKMTKTALSGVSQQSSCQRGVAECSVCARVFCQPIQACSGPEALSSLNHTSPADSSQVRAQEPCPAAQRPRESAYCSGSLPEKLQGPGALTVSRDVPR